MRAAEPFPSRTAPGPRLFCDDLETVPLSGSPRILVTGASGYVGGRLVPELQSRGYRVRAMFRTPDRPYPREWKGIETVYADCTDADALRHAMAGVRHAFYLIHSMAVSAGEFETADLAAASLFRAVAAESGVERIFYLGALRAPDGVPASLHLRSRRRVEEVLAEGPVPLTCLRAGIIVGSGSASFEMIRGMVAQNRILPVVRQFRSRCQPIAIRDVIKSLVGVMELPETTGRSFDVGGPEAHTYEELVRGCARALDRKVRIVYVPNLWPGFVAWWLSLATPVPRRIAAALLESLDCDVVCREDSIRQWLDFRRIPYEEAVARALRREALDDVPTRWSDASLGIRGGPPLARLLPVRSLRRYKALRVVRASPPRVFNRLVRIGGEKGWLHANWAWSLRGKLDRLLGGVGLRRGRRSRSELRRGDVLDFWRVEEVEPGRLLLLRSEMRMPGDAWLSFVLDARGEEECGLEMVAYFRPRGLAGRLYWYALLPVHRFILKGLLRRLGDAAERPN